MVVLSDQQIKTQMYSIYNDTKRKAANPHILEAGMFGIFTFREA